MASPPAASTTSTGYGPSWHSRRLCFNGTTDNYELWEVKFFGHLRLRKLTKVITAADGAVDAEENACVFAELIQLLDDRSLSLIIREARDDGRKSLKILREHYMSNSKNRIIGMYTELTSLKMCEDNVTDYLIKVETAANALREVKEIISDSLLIAMTMKGLPSEYKTFCTIITQKEKELTFAEFKTAIRTHEENQKSCAIAEPSENVVMRSSDQHVFQRDSYDEPFQRIVCYSCNRPGHKSSSCRQRGRMRYSYTRGRPHRGGPQINHSARMYEHFNDRIDDGNSNVVVSSNNVQNDFYFKVSETLSTEHDKLLIDCGATAHIINKESLFVDFYQDFDPSKHTIELADGSKQNNVIKGKGTAKLTIRDQSGLSREIFLENALFVPSFKQNILSVQAATSKGAFLNFDQNSAVFATKKGIKFDIEKTGRLYYLNSVSDRRTLDNWHRTMGHCNVKDLFSLQKVVKGMKIMGAARSFDCDICTLGKMPEFRNRTPDSRAKVPFELVHTDLAGPIHPTSKEGHNYAQVFIDDFSSVQMIYFLKRKSNALQATKMFLADIAPYRRVLRLRSDNGTEFTSNDFKSLMIENQIRQEFSAPYSPHQKGTAERSWRSIFDMARCMILEAKVPKFLWTYAAMSAVFIRNPCFNNRLGMTPYQALMDREPDLSKLHVFGSTCYAYVQDKSKLDPRSKKGVFIGYDKYSPAYFVYFSDDMTVKRVRCVKCFEQSGSDMDESGEPDMGYPPVVSPPVSENIPAQVDIKDSVPIKVESNVQNVEGGISHYNLRSNVSKPKYLDDYITNVKSDVHVDSENGENIDYFYKVAIDIPNDYKEAIISKNSNQWVRAMEEEFKALGENKTFDYVELPSNKNLVSSKWVFTVKNESNGEEKYKARFVARGFFSSKRVRLSRNFFTHS